MSEGRCQKTTGTIRIARPKVRISTIPNVRRKRSKLCFSTWPGSMDRRGSCGPPSGLLSGARSFAAFCAGLSVIVAMVIHDVGQPLLLPNTAEAQRQVAS